MSGFEKEVYPKATALSQILFSDPDFSDVTLVCRDGQKVVAHKAVLASSSNFLRRILADSTQQNTFLYVGMVEFEVVASLVKYIYLGFHDPVTEEQLEQLTCLAIQLGVAIEADADPAKGEVLQRIDQSGFGKQIQNTNEETNKVFGNYKTECEEDLLNQNLDKAQSSLDVSVSQTHGVSQAEIQKRISRTLYKVEPNENLKYKCEECESEYSKRASLIKHRLHIHDGFSYDCELCGEKFSRSSKLKAHKDVVHQGLSFDCDLCGKVFETSKRLLSHKTRSKETCKLCNFVACNHHIFVKHLTTHDPLYQNNAFSCDVCGYRARKRVILKTHIKVVHEKFRLSCDLCEFKSKDKSAIREHKMAVHEGIKLKCNECDYECNMKKQMSKHTNTVHSDIEYKCKLCEFTTKDKWNLRKHDKNVHEQLRRECPICGISVAYNTSMQRHIRQVHGGEKPKTKHSDLSCKETNCCVEDEQNKTQ